MADSRTGAGKVQDEWGACSRPENRKVLKKKMAPYQKDTEASLKKVPMASARIV